MVDLLSQVAILAFVSNGGPINGKIAPLGDGSAGIVNITRDGGQR